jgi:hypothetical protein
LQYTKFAMNLVFPPWRRLVISQQVSLWHHEQLCEVHITSHQF